MGSAHFLGGGLVNAFPVSVGRVREKGSWEEFMGYWAKVVAEGHNWFKEGVLFLKGLARSDGQRKGG